MSTIDHTNTGEAASVASRLGSLVAEERRSSARFSVAMPATLVDPCGDEAVRCSMTGIAEGGVYVLAPTSSGVSLGRRFELRLQDSAVPPELTNLTGQGLYATVIRTERTKQSGTIGVGLRFDQPLFL